MKITCLCCTYLRPEQLANSVACFEALDFPINDRELIVLDDAGQYRNQPSGERWEVVSVRRRFATLGQKRNALAALADTDTDAFAVWDDDDAYLPWTLRAHESVLLDGVEWSAPQIILNELGNEPYFQYHKAKDLFHASWCVTRNAFKNVRGYSWKNSGEDQEFGSRMARAKVPVGDPVKTWPPYFVHRWSTSGSWHLSAYGSEGYEKVGLKKDAATDIAGFTPRLTKPWGAMVRDFLYVETDATNSGLRSRWAEIRQGIVKQLGLGV